MKFRNILNKAVIGLVGLTAVSGLLSLTGCTDDYLLSEAPKLNSRSSGLEGIDFDKDAGLIPLEDGTWKATRRVPLVGYCRIVDQLMHSLVSVGSVDVDLSKVTDTDLTNSAHLRGEAVGAEVGYNAVISIRDLNYTYAGGQKAGFVVKISNSGVLSLNVLQQMVLVTSYLGVEQERKTVTTSSSVLGLGLGNVTTGDSNMLTTLEAEFTKKFDEIRLDNGGVNANAIKEGLEVYYAFVGETPIEPVIKSTFPNCSTDTSDPASEKKLIDDNLNNGPGYGLIAAGRWRVNFGEIMDAGSEVGFYITSGSLLNLGLGATYILRTFDEDGNLMDEMSSTDIVGLGLASGEDLYYSMVASGPCSGVEFALAGVSVTVGGGTVHYAYARKPAQVDATSYFALANATVYVPNYRLPNVDEGTVSYTLVSGPCADAKVVMNSDNSWAVTGMYVPGNYVVRGEWKDNTGKVHVEYSTITRRVRTTKSCNEPIVSGEVFNDLEAYLPSAMGAVLQIPIGKGINGSLENVINDDLNDAITFSKGLDIGVVNINGLLGVRKKDGSPLCSTGATEARVGFVVNKENGVLGADVLNFYQVRVLDAAGNVIESAVSGGVNVSLIKGLDNPRVRLSINVPAGIDIYAIELYNVGLLELQLATDIDVYYAFLDRDAASSCPDPGQECLELLNAGNYRVSASVEGFAVIGAGATVTNLGNMLDGRLDSYATVAVPLSVANDVTIATKFDPIKAGTPVGFILYNQVDLAQVVKVMKIRIHYANETYEDVTIGGAANVTLGVDEYDYIQVFPKEGDSGYDIVGLDLILGQGVDIQGFNICGLFSRSDANADGVPDCLEDQTNGEGYNPILKLSSNDICASDLLEILVEGADDGKYILNVARNDIDYMFDFDVEMNDAGYLAPTKNATEDFLKFFSDSKNAGVYSLRLIETGGTESASDPVILKLHPYKTAWTGNGEDPTDWKDWHNWDNGEPWECTDVIMPAPAKLGANAEYSALEAKGDYRCQSIHFEAGAVVSGQQFLKYTGRVFADVELEAGDYHLMSSPLKSTITGDMFVNTDWKLDWDFGSDGKWDVNGFDSYFQTLTADNYVEKRVSPTVYQRFWDERIPAIVTMSRSLTDAEFKDWTRTFNAVTEAYTAYQGFAVRVGKAGDKGNYTLNFPKSHTKYTYFDAEGRPLKASESINRSTQVGRLWTDNFKGNAIQHIDLTRNTPGREFLFGNPFLTYIDVAKFKKSNPGVAVWKYSNGEYSEMVNGTIAPFSAVFLIVGEESDDLEVTLNVEDLTNIPAGE